MARLPFNPDHVPPEVTSPDHAAAAPASGGGASGAGASGAGASGGGGTTWTVMQVAGMIKNALAEGIAQPIRVVGEVSNLSDRQHWFFSLKDEQAALRCVCFASAARRIRFPVANGMQVVATGRIDYYDAQGHVQLYVDKMEPVGQGTLELRLRQMMEQLRGLGYFEEARKKPLPPMPRTVAVVTSRAAAALQDVINTAQQRWRGCRLLLYDVRVQGEAAAPEIAAAIERLSAHGPGLGIDAIILTRGGGSIEDLWAFNERSVADALYRCALPVVAAIGHETDTTVAELVADCRCSTPTQAAMRLIPDQRALEQQLSHLGNRLRQDVARRVQHEARRVEACANRSLFRRPGDLVDQAGVALDGQSRRLARALPQRIEGEARALTAAQARLAGVAPRLLAARKQRLESLTRHLQAVSPHHVLKRGYSYTLGPDGHVLRKPADVRPGEMLTTRLAEGEVRSRVEGNAEASRGVSPPDDPPQASPDLTQPKARRSRPSRKPKDDQPGLF